MSCELSQQVTATVQHEKGPSRYGKSRSAYIVYAKPYPTDVEFLYIPSNLYNHIFNS